MSTSLLALRELMMDSVQADRYIGLTTTSAGAADGTTLVATGLGSLPGGGDNDFCEGFYVIITELVTDGPAVGESQRITDYVASTYTITTPAFTAQVKTGTNFELHRYDPQDVNNAINRACELIFPHLYTAKRDETLMTDQLLSNADGETYSSTFTSWTHTVATWTQESTRKIHDTYSFKGVGGGAAAQLTQNLFSGTNIHEIAGKTLNFKGWIWASAASTARLRVSFDGGSTFTNGTYHEGSSEWEGPSTQYISVTVPTTATSMTVYLEVAAGGTAYFDALSVYIDPIYRYTIPSAIIRGPFRVSFQSDLTKPDGPYLEVTDWHYEEYGSGRYIVLDEALPSGRILRVEGQGILTTMSTDSATTEVDAPKTHLLVARALQYFYEQMAADAALADGEMYERDALKWAGRVQELIRTPGMRMLSRAFQVHPRRYMGA